MQDEDHEEADLWFLPGPMEEGPDPLPGPRAGPEEGDVVATWRAAQAELSGPLASLTWHLGALDARLSAGPEGWSHRLAYMEASELSWLGGARISQDRILLWVALRLSTAQADPQDLSRAAWAARRLTEGPGPEAGLAQFLARHAVDPGEQGEYLEDRVASWSELMGKTVDLHPVTRAALSYWSWSLAGLDRGPGAQIEAAVTAARLGLPASARRLVFLPLAIGGAGQGLRASGPPRERLRRWIAGAETATLAALRHVEDLRAWRREADQALERISGRWPRQMVDALEGWPILSAAMAEHVTGASRASVHRALDWLTEQGLAREVTGQGRFRFWAAIA